jgi:hypothetical protein
LKSTKADQARPRSMGLALLLLVPLLGACIVLYHTRFGPGTTGDSIRYIMGAENLLAGNGYSRTSGGGEIRPITGFPPFYSIVLAALGFLTGDIFNNVRFLHSLLFAANLLLIGLLIFRYTGSFWATLLGQFLVLSEQRILWLHTWVLTETLFIFMILVGIYTLVAYLDSKKITLLILGSIAVSLATITRYIGVALTAAGGLSVLILNDTTWKRRLLDGLILGGTTLLPLVLWFRRNAAISGTIANRMITYDAIPLQNIRIYIADMLSWFAPRILGLPRPIRNVFVALLAIPAPLVFFFRELKVGLMKGKREQRPFWTLPWILAFFLFFYAIILVLNSTLLDPALTRQGQSRYLVPPFVVAVILFTLVGHRLLENSKWISPKPILTLAVAVFLIIVYAYESWLFLRDPLFNIGYTGLRTLWPDTVKAIQSLDPEVAIVTNNPEMAYILSGQPAYMMPLLGNVSTGELREDFDQQIEATREKLEEGGVLFILGHMTTYDREVIELLEAEAIGVFFDSAMFGYPEAVKWE